MPRVCLACTHPKRAEIDRRLALRIGAKRQIASEYGITERSLHRHETGHLEPRLIEAAVEAAKNEVLTARQVSLEAVTNARKIANSCLEISPQQYLDALDPLLKANDQWAKINRELGNDQLNAFFLEIGVRGGDEVKSRLALTDRLEDAPADDVIEEALLALRIHLPKHPERLEDARRVLDSVSYAEVIETNGGPNGKS